MYLRMSCRKKNGKEHRSWSVVESHRTRDGRVLQRHVLYLGEINDSQQEAWWRTIGVLENGQANPQQVSLLAEDRRVPSQWHEVIHVKVNQMRLERPRRWGACWLACRLWEELKLDAYWAGKLPPSREGTRWLNVLKTLVCYRLIAPGSEWRLHRDWYGKTALGDLLGEEAVMPYQNLYRCLDKLLPHKDGLFGFLQQRWRDLFQAGFDLLLYDLTSTYFECDPPETGKRRFGYSRDKRPDCVQVIIALVITPEGLPLAYEVLEGNTSDRTTLRSFLNKIETQYGKARRVWVMDRGIPTEEVLEEMRQADPPVCYLVGTPKARLNKLAQEFVGQGWEQVQEQVEVKLVQQDNELYVLARSGQRTAKERAIRQRRLKQYWRRLGELSQQQLSRDQLLIKIGKAQKEAGPAARLVDLILPAPDPPATAETFRFQLRRDKLRHVRRQEGQYLLRSNLCQQDSVTLWKYYIQLVEIEQAFKNLKHDLALRPIYHQKDHRIEAHIFVAFLSYCLHVTLQQRLKALAPGLTVRSVLAKLESIEMIDVHLPTSDGRELILPRYTQPDKEQLLLLSRMNLDLPPQPKPQLLKKDAALGQLQMHL